MYLPFSAIPKGSYIYDTVAFITNLNQLKAAVCRIYMIVAVIGKNTVICLYVGANRITCQLIKLFAIHFKDVVCNSHGVFVLIVRVTLSLLHKDTTNSCNNNRKGKVFSNYFEIISSLKNIV